MKVNKYIAESCKLLTDAGLGPKEIAKVLKIGRTSYNYLKRANFDLAEYKKLIHREKKLPKTTITSTNSTEPVWEDIAKTLIPTTNVWGTVLVDKQHIRKIISMLQDLLK